MARSAILFSALAVPGVAWDTSFLTAQSVTGWVLDAATGDPIASASVRLLNEQREDLQGTLTDSSGRFTLNAPFSGRYLLRAGRIGYEEIISPEFDLLANETLSVEMRISVQAIVLAPLTVISDRRPLLLDQRLVRQNFYERRDRYEDMGFGYFFEYDEIQRHNPFNISDVVRTVPSMRTVATGGRHYEIRGRTGCQPSFFLNGHKVHLGIGQTIDDVVSPNSLVAIEVYPSKSFSAIDYAGCSILLWTGPPPNSN